MSDNGACAETAGNGDISTIGTPATTESYRTAWANASDTPFRLYKSYVHEGGVSSPLIVHWPKGLTVPKAPFARRWAIEMDLMPTFLELAGARYPSEFNRQRNLSIARQKSGTHVHRKGCSQGRDLLRT